MGNDSINFSLANVWHSWQKFRQGKQASAEIEKFSYYLEKNLFEIYQDLNEKTYAHSSYRKFVVTDNKKREISVASIKDRVIHRLVYQYLVGKFNKHFDFDAWSCRKNKGLIGAIERAQHFAIKYKNFYVWRVDIKKFFDNVNQNILLKLIGRKIKNENAIWLIKEIISSYSSGGSTRERERESNLSLAINTGMPIGNLTSQIFANIYLNELDRYVRHKVSAKAYVRYGDDFLIFEFDLEKLKCIREDVIGLLKNDLKLEVNRKNDIVIKVSQGIRFLGVIIYPNGRKLSKRNLKRSFALVNTGNVSSYQSLIKHHQLGKLKEFDWNILEKINNE